MTLRSPQFTEAVPFLQLFLSGCISASGILAECCMLKENGMRLVRILRKL